MTASLKTHKNIHVLTCFLEINDQELSFKYEGDGNQMLGSGYIRVGLSCGTFACDPNIGEEKQMFSSCCLQINIK